MYRFALALCPLLLTGSPATQSDPAGLRAEPGIYFNKNIVRAVPRLKRADFALGHGTQSTSSGSHIFEFPVAFTRREGFVLSGAEIVAILFNCETQGMEWRLSSLRLRAVEGGWRVDDMRFAKSDEGGAKLGSGLALLTDFFRLLQRGAPEPDDLTVRSVSLKLPPGAAGRLTVVFAVEDTAARSLRDRLNKAITRQHPSFRGLTEVEPPEGAKGAYLEADLLVRHPPALDDIDRVRRDTRYVRQSLLPTEVVVDRGTGRYYRVEITAGRFLVARDGEVIDTDLLIHRYVRAMDWTHAAVVAVDGLRRDPEFQALKPATETPPEVNATEIRLLESFEGIEDLTPAFVIPR